VGGRARHVLNAIVVVAVVAVGGIVKHVLNVVETIVGLRLNAAYIQ
jgi:hypothetical protein